MSITMLFADEEDNFIDPFIEKIKNILKDEKMSSYSIFKNIKKEYPEEKCCYNDIDKICKNMLTKKFGKQLNKEGRNPCLYFINNIDKNVPSILKKRNLKEVNKSNIIFDEKSYISPINTINEQYNISNFKESKVYRKKYLDIDNISSKNHFNIDTIREESLNDILNYQYEKFIESRDMSILDNIATIKKIKNNI